MKILLFACCYLNVTTAFIFSSARDAKICGSFLEILNAFHSTRSCTSEPAPVIESTASSFGFFARLPRDLQCMSLLSYSSLTDILALSGLNKPISSLIKHEVKHMIALSNPHFVTHDFFMNVLLFVLIRDHFTIDSSSISYPIITDSPSPHIYDSLELLSARYFHDALDFDSMPRNVYYYAICFFNELLYGRVGRLRFFRPFVSALGTDEKRPIFIGEHGAACRAGG